MPDFNIQFGKKIKYQIPAPCHADAMRWAEITAERMQYDIKKCIIEEVSDQQEE